MIVTVATEADCRAIGIVHVLAWHETYRGIVPDAVLASLDPRERAALWQKVIAHGGVFALREGARVVGFGAAGPNRDASLAHAGMFNALYLLRHAQRQGHGRALLAAMARHLLDTGLPDAVVWVAEANTAAHRFYEGRGGGIVGYATELHEGWDMKCAAYGWDDLSGLVQAAP